MNIYLIRHGDPNYEKNCLTPLGHEEALKLSERMKIIPLTDIYCSPFGRSIETMNYTAAYFPFKPVIYDWMREIEWGDLSGDAYASESPWIVSDRMITEEHYYPEGDIWERTEPFSSDRIVDDVEMRRRKFDGFLAENGYKRDGQLYFSEKPNDKEIAIFCHGGLICALISHMLNIPFLQFCVHFPIYTTGVCKLSFEGAEGTYGAVKACYINDASHLI